MEEHKSPRPFCEEITKRVEKGADWAMYQFYRAAYVYYTDSFTKVLNTEEELNRFLNQPNQSIVAMRDKEYQKLNESFKVMYPLIYQKKIGHCHQSGCWPACSEWSPYDRASGEETGPAGRC